MEVDKDLLKLFEKWVGVLGMTHSEHAAVLTLAQTVKECDASLDNIYGVVDEIAKTVKGVASEQ